MAELRVLRPKGDVPDDPLSRLRHSCSHAMADAVRRLFPDAKVAIGPSVEAGFYCDFEVARPFTGRGLILWHPKGGRVRYLKEAQGGTVSPRQRDGKQLEVMPLDTFVERLRKEAAVPTVAKQEERP